MSETDGGTDHPSTPEGARPRDIGITLSGGGSRASVFGLGALLALADAGLRDRTVSISSVSGGSIANGAVMVGPDFGTAPTADIEAHVARLVKSFAERGMLLGGAPATAWYLRSLIAGAALTALALVATVVGGFAGWPVVVAIGVAAFVAFGWLTVWLFTRRSAATERAIDKELLGGTSTTLAAHHERDLSVHHVICTTELQAGTTFYFSNRMVYGWEFGGTTRPSDVPLSTAVQASACVPGAFRARTVGLPALRLTPAEMTPQDHAAGDDPAERIVIVDGGVYDNMADSWEYGFRKRAKRWSGLGTAQPNPAQQLIVVNASSDWHRLRPVDSGGLKLEVDSLMRTKDVQYDVSTSHRRQALGGLFISATDEEQLDGVFVQIKDSPYRLAGLFRTREGRTPTERSRWADEALAFLNDYGVPEDEWDRIADASSGVPTTLAPLGTDVSAALLEHGYMLATANLHVIFGHGDLSRTVDRDRFTRLARGESGGTS